MTDIREVMVGKKYVKGKGVAIKKEAASRSLLPSNLI